MSSICKSTTDHLPFPLLYVGMILPFPSANPNFSSEQNEEQLNFLIKLANQGDEMLYSTFDGKLGFI